MNTITKVGLVGAIAGAMGYYFYGSENAKKNRSHALEWMKKAEKEVFERVSELKDSAFNEKNYKKIVNEVGEKYRMLHKLSSKEIVRFITVVSDAWEDLKEEAGEAAHDVRREVRRARA